MAARQVLSRPFLNRFAPFTAPRVVPKRNYITYRPKWADNDPVRPHQWGTRIARWFMRLPEMAYGLVYFVVAAIFMYHKYYIQQVHPEYSYMVCDPYVDNPMLPFDKANYISTEMEKIQMHMYGNRTLYHQVHRPEDGVTEGAPWTDKRADLYLKRYFSVGNQKMLLENKVERYMEETKDGSNRLNVGFFDYGMPGWTSARTYMKHEPKYDYPLPYNGEKPNKEMKF